MSEYKPDVLRGHEYDGIEEYDNRIVVGGPAVICE